MLPDDEPPPSRSIAPGWMITFADLLSLLLTFFVLVFATTTMEQKDWQRIVQPISAYLSGHAVTAPKVVTPAPTPAARLDLAYVETLLSGLVAGVPALAGTRVVREEHTIIVTLRPGLDWRRGTPAPLADLARLLSGLDNRIEVLAHGGVDRSPRAAAVADWRRALDQAQAVSAELARLGYGGTIDASGSADLAGGAQALQIDILIFDSAAEAGHAAP
jgi:chemotaxis protein MotB